MINSHDNRRRERRFVWGHNRKNSKKTTYERQRNDLKYYLNKRMSTSIRSHIKSGIKNNRHWCDLVGYTVEQLEKRLKSTMPEGYTWQDFLNGKLHIDHIIPVSVFNFDFPEHLDFQRCWALSNLQLLPAKENSKKGIKLSETFQSSLKL